MRLLLTTNGRLGDVLAITAGVRDLKKQYPDYLIKVNTTNKVVWNNNPYLSDYNEEPDLIIDSLLSEVTQGSKMNGHHIIQGARLTLESKLKIKIKQEGIYPDLHLTKEEKNNRVIKQNYWLINTEFGNEASETKKWIAERWQEVVDKLPFITFVQTGTTRIASLILKGDNVIDYVGKTENLRDLFSLFYNCEGVICLIGGNAHLAAAFKKPCVVIAGSNEPSTFEAYPFHRYLSNIGSLPCSENNGCWKCKLSGCKNLVNNVPKCKEMITSDDVVKAVTSYYDGGRLILDKEININLNKKRLLKLICNAHSFGGAERSCVEIAKLAKARDIDVDIISPNPACSEFKNAVGNVNYTNNVTAKANYILFYASDMVFNLDKPMFDVFKNIKADKKYMALTYRKGKVGEIEWTKDNWKYLFLCFDLENKVREKIPNMISKIMAPCVDLEPFFKIERNYNFPIHVIRHSSQGDTKWDKTILNTVKYSNVNFSFMPSPSYLELNTVINYPFGSMKVEDFLKIGNCFIYNLPQGYIDNGSRCIVEALASGLAVIGDDWGGAKDRVDESCGWLFSYENRYKIVDLINNLTPEILEQKGKMAREKAKKEFIKEKWIEEIIG